MSTSLPFVSTVVAAYNYERYLGAALDSALAQDYPSDRLEIIVVDDGSTDGTPEVAKRYASQQPGRVRYVRQENAGPAAATSCGLQEARGELIALLDADDVWVRSRTRLLVDALRRNPRAGLVYGDMEVIDADGATIAPSWLQEASQTPFHGRCTAQFLRSNFIMTSSLMVRAELRDCFCPMPAWFHTQDWPIAARVAEVAEIDFLPAVVARYRRHGANLTNGKQGQHEVALMLRRDAPMRRWMLANVRSSDLTVEDLAAAYDYFWQTIQFAAGALNVNPEAFLETDPERESAERKAGDAALAEGEFVAAAGHFLAALAADPFSIRSRHGLDHARRRLIVPAPRSADARNGNDYRIKPGYTSREAPEYFVDLAEERTGVLYQPDVYARAVEVATRVGATWIIDLGAGNGDKLAAIPPSFEILGLDYGPNVELARRRHPDGIWREHNFDRPGELPLTPDQLRRSIVVCANVIEQLIHPEHLLGNLREILRSARAIVISTPERDLTHGPDHVGPPTDRTRVREWNVEEFATLLEAFGFENGELELTRSDNVRGARDTIVAILYPAWKEDVHE
jgi:Glycosyl transferase family 2